MPDQESHEGTIWSNDPHRGTVWSNNPHEGTVWDNRYGYNPPATTWTQAVERERQGGGPIPSQNRSSSRFSVPTIALFLVIFNLGIIYAHSALAGVITSNTAGSANLRHALLSWLSHAVYIFASLASLILIIHLLLRRYFAGLMLIIAAGLLSFMGTGIYLVISGVFFGK